MSQPQFMQGPLSFSVSVHMWLLFVVNILARFASRHLTLISKVPKKISYVPYILITHMYTYIFARNDSVTLRCPRQNFITVSVKYFHILIPGYKKLLSVAFLQLWALPESTSQALFMNFTMYQTGQLPLWVCVVSCQIAFSLFNIRASFMSANISPCSLLLLLVLPCVGVQSLIGPRHYDINFHACLSGCTHKRYLNLG